LERLEATTKQKERLRLIGLLQAIIENATRQLAEEQREIEKMKEKYATLQ
jgi:superfamily II RNA helicase